MARITGIGGVVFLAKSDHEQLAAWYARHLGLSLEEWGGAILEWPDDRRDDGGITVWHVAARDSDWFRPRGSSLLTARGGIAHTRRHDPCCMLLLMRALRCPWRSLLAAVLVIGTTSACGGGTEADQDAAPDPDSGGELALRGVCEAAERLGGFVVEEYETYSIVQGKAANGIVPVTVPDQVHDESGCRLLERRQLFCTPGCGATETCDEGNVCIPFPENQDLGTVTVDGLKAAVVMEPIQPTNIYFDSQLPHPAYDPLDVISLCSTDGYYGVLELSGIGVHPLELPDEIWVVEPNEPLPLSWTPPSAEVRSRILFSLNIDQHGTTPLTLHCDFADTGTATVPASVIDALLSYPTSGWPSGLLRRHTADRAEVSGGCVDFVVSSPKTGNVRVAGHIPCDAVTPCPPGLTCNIPIGTCE